MLEVPCCCLGDLVTLTVWLVRLEGRLNILASQLADLKASTSEDCRNLEDTTHDLAQSRGQIRENIKSTCSALSEIRRLLQWLGYLEKKGRS